MADPASAAPSRRKRAPPPPAASVAAAAPPPAVAAAAAPPPAREAKRARRAASAHAHSAETAAAAAPATAASSSRSRSKTKNSKQRTQNTKQETKSKSQSDLKPSTSSHKDRANLDSHQLRRSSRSNPVDLATVDLESLERRPKKRHSQGSPKDRLNSAESVSERYKSKKHRKNSASPSTSKGRNEERKDKEKDKEEKHKSRGVKQRRIASSFNLNVSLNYSIEHSEPSTSTGNLTYPRPHPYPLRSQQRRITAPDLAATPSLAAAKAPPPPSSSTGGSRHRGRASAALGASASGGHQQVPAAVAAAAAGTAAHTSAPPAPHPHHHPLRRSARNARGGVAGPAAPPTTGSCASTGGTRRPAAEPPHHHHQQQQQPPRHHQEGGAAGGGGQPQQHHRRLGAAAAMQAPPTDGTAAAPAGQATKASEEPPSPHQESAQAMAVAPGAVGGGADSESDDGEVGRLQALLEARGLPPHLFGALGPRVQHLLHRSMGSNSSVARAQALLPGLQATGDEGQQLQAVIEMCQVLVMGNEEILTGFPVKQVVPALITLLGMEHNFDIMNHACRALTYMMEALPRSSAVVVDAVPVFLEKLQVIQCMDVAEQSLTALDMLSRRHSKSILQAGGVSACLMYLDFFSINAQRNALSITANCCLNLMSEEFQYVQESLPLLASRLTQQDKKCVESVCLAFSRLIDSFQLEPARLQEIASTELLTNLQQLLVVTPPIISTGTFITVLRMLSVMCANCPDLALTLLKQSIAETLLYLLTGSAEVNQDNVELVPRQPQELFEITALIGELMPKLPTDGIFAVDSLLERTINIAKDQRVWQWRDDRGWWHPYGAVDSRIIEAAYLNGDDDVSLNTLGRIYTIDFHSMNQINEDTGTTRPVQRLCTPSNVKSSPAEPSQSSSRPNSASRDARVACLREERGLAAAFIRSLFSVLYEVYSSSAGPAVRCKCLKALLRMVYYANSDLLRDVLKNQVVSSHIAGMMASSDLRIVVGALQMAEILMTKLPDEFGVHFRREGVLHQINRLADPDVPLGASPPKSASCSTTSFTTTPNDSQPSTSQPSSSSTPSSAPNGSAAPPVVAPALYSSTPDAQRLQEADARSPSPTVRLSDVLKRKRVTKRPGGTGRAKTRQDDLPISPSLMQDLFSKATSLAGGTATPNNPPRSRYAGSSSKTSFLQSLNPARWGRSVNSSHDRNYSKDSLNNLSKSSSNSHITAGNREKTRSWIREQSSKFLETYCGSEDGEHPATTVLTRLKLAIDKLPTGKCGEALLELREILMESDISPFEVNYSGLIKALLSFLADINGPFDRDQRLRILLNVFADLPLEHDVRQIGEVNSTWMSALVAKLNGCVSQLEQFPVKVHDLPANSGAGRGGTSALKFFNTHQLKCNLQRHPDCTNLKQWKGGTVKIDPLALVQAIERYLVVRGYGRLRDKDSADSDDGDTDDDIDDTLAGVVISQTGTRHKLQFLIGNNVLPYNMTVYQAVRQFSNGGNDQSETDTDNETPLGNAGIWVQTHVIYYRPLKEDPPISLTKSTGSASSHPSRKGKGSSGKGASRRKGDELWTEGVTPPVQSPLAPFLTNHLPDTVTIQDASLEVLCLLRVLHALNTYWSTLYTHVEYRPILLPSEFLNSKVAAKASRQLQDPLVIMTGNLPNWLQQVATVCPFLFPFETRQLLFYATSFDRDRALQRLLDMSPELSSSDSQERVTPRLDRRKRTISREDILKQAEQVMQDLASSKALLEVQYENEVGTGLGPTLEFYALVSKELQKTNLELWYASETNVNEYMHSQAGLFPAPLSRGAKVSQITRARSKFRFLGRFMAKAVMDSRMLDLPFSHTFYRWLLGQEHSLGLADVRHVNPDIYVTLRKMHEIVRERDEILCNGDLPEEEKMEQVENLTFDGCPISDLGIDFVIPACGVELIKNGRQTHVTVHNLHVYVRAMSYWLLREGVNRQMEALREGFDSVFPVQNLKVFRPDELEAVFCGSPKDYSAGWDTKTLMECCRPDHGYTADSRAIRFLFEVLSSYDREERRMFVQFLTGSPRLPVGGFKALSPPLTVVRKTLEGNLDPDDFLPSVMTCVNYLKLPDYSSMEVMRNKLRLAASEGQHSFYLS